MVIAGETLVREKASKFITSNPSETNDISLYRPSNTHMTIFQEPQNDTTIFTEQFSFSILHLLLMEVLSRKPNDVEKNQPQNLHRK